MIALVVGFGTVSSPRANWTITGCEMYGAYAAGLPVCCAQMLHSRNCWIASWSGVAVTYGRLRSGLFSVKFVNDALGTALYSDGECVSSAIPTSGRNDGLSRAISDIGPPGTFGTPARTSGSRPSSCTP